MKKILVTGGAGFIGSHIVEMLLERGDEVVCLDNLSSGSQANVDLFQDNPRYTFVNQDLTTPNFALNEKFACIYHFACPASPNPDSPVSYLARPIETMLVSSVGAKNVLDLANASNCQIIIASTSEVYGDPEIHPQKEDYVGHVSSIGIRSPYDEGKRFQEALSFAYFRKYQTKIKVVRIFNTYGPRMRLDDGRFVINLVKSIISDLPFKLYGDGSSTRSFCYIDDLIRGLAQVEKTEGVVGQVVNLGNDEELKISEAIKIVEEQTGKKLVIDAKSEQSDDPKRRQPDLTKAYDLLGFKPSVRFAEGIQKTLNYYQQL